MVLKPFTYGLWSQKLKQITWNNAMPKATPPMINNLSSKKVTAAS